MNLLASFQDPQPQDMRNRFSNLNLIKQSLDLNSIKFVNRSKSPIQSKNLKNNRSYTQLHGDKPNKENLYSAGAINLTTYSVQQPNSFSDNNMSSIQSCNSYTNSYYQQHKQKKIKQYKAAQIIQKWFRKFRDHNFNLRNQKSMPKMPWIGNRQINNRLNAKSFLKTSKSYYGINIFGIKITNQ